MFNLGYNQQLEELQKNAFVQTQLFKLSYDDYIKNYKNKCKNNTKQTNNLKYIYTFKHSFH